MIPSAHRMIWVQITESFLIIGLQNQVAIYRIKLFILQVTGLFLSS